MSDVAQQLKRCLPYFSMSPRAMHGFTYRISRSYVERSIFPFLLIKTMEKSCAPN